MAARRRCDQPGLPDLDAEIEELSAREYLRGLLLAVAVLAAVPAVAEIHRLSLEETMPKIVAAMGPSRPDTPIRVDLDDFVSKIPVMVRVTLPEPGARGIEAIFAVKQPGGEANHGITVRMRRMEDRTYEVARSSRRAFRSWLDRRSHDLVLGNIVLEEIVGVEAAGIVFHLSVGDVAAELLSGEEPDPDGRLTERAVGHILGTSVVDAGFADLEGRDRRFAEFEGRALLVNIWATWCVPCIAEMPALEALQERYRDQGLTVVNLSDEPARVWRDWLAENGSTMLHGRVDGFGFLLGDPPVEGVDPDLGVRPVYVVVDREGIVRNVRIGSVKVGIVGKDGEAEDESEHQAAVWVKPYL